MATPQLKRVLSVWDVALFNIVVVFSLRGLATASKMGPISLLLWVVAVGLFFVPLGLAVAEMGTRDPGEGGFYRWTRLAFGDAHGFLAGWSYWVSNLTYLPSLLIFTAGNAVYVLGRPALGENPWFVGSSAVVLLWLAAWLNVRGLETARWVTNAGALAGWLAGVLIIAAGAVAALRLGSQTEWSIGAGATGLAEWRTLGYFGTLSFALVGLELVAVMGGEIRDPQRALPRAMLLSGVTIAVLYIAGTAAVLVSVPASDVSPISGAIGALQAVSDRAGWPFLPATGAGLVAVAAVAGLSGWLGGTARLPFAAGLDRFLPASFARLHPRHGSPHVAILVQTVVTTLFILASQLGSSVREAYLVLLDTTIILNFVPFLYLFLAVPLLRRERDEPGVVRIPGGLVGLWCVALAGLGATLLTLGTAVIPPPDVESPLVFEAKLWGGLGLFAAAGYALYRRFARARS